MNQQKELTEYINKIKKEFEEHTHTKKKREININRTYELGLLLKESMAFINDSPCLCNEDIYENDVCCPRCCLLYDHYHLFEQRNCDEKIH